MEKNILSEVNRIKEIMGVKIISEAAPPPGNFLTKLLGEIIDSNWGGAIDIDKVIKKLSPDLAQNEVDNIISKLLSKQFTDVALQEIDLNKLFKQILRQSDASTKKLINQVTIDLIKNEYFTLHDSLKNIPSQIRSLNTFLRDGNKETYDKLLKLLYDQKNIILNSKNLDQNIKNIIIEAYGLDKLPLPSKFLVYTNKNKNLLRDSIRKETLRPGNKFGSFQLNNNEKNLLKDFVDNKITFDALDDDLQDKVIFFLRDNNIKIDGKDKKIINEYFKNLLLSKNYIKNGKVDEVRFYRDVYNLTQEGMSTSEALNNLIGESDSKLLYRYVDEFIGSFGELEDLARNAPKQTKWSGFKNWFENYEAKLFNYIKYFRETSTPSLKVMFGEDKFIADVEEKLNSTLSKIAKKITDGKGDTTYGDWDTIFNLLVTLNTSPQKRGAAKLWLDNNLINNKNFTNNEDLAVFMKTSDYKFLLESVEKTFDEIFSEYIKRVLTSFARLTLIFNPKLYTKGHRTEIFSDLFKSWSNLLIWADPMGVNDMRQLYALMGTKGVFFDKAIKYVGVQLFLIPYAKAIVSEIMIFSDIRNARQTLDVLKTACDKNLIEKAECEKVNEYIVQIEQRPTETEIANELRDWIPVVGSTNIDDFAKFVINWYEQAAYKVGPGQATEDVFKNWQKTVLPQIETIDTESKKFLEELGVKYNLKFDTEENTLRSLTKLTEIIQNSDKIDASPKGFNAWAVLNGYTVSTPYDTETGIGKAYKNNDTTKTPVEFEFRDGTFK